MRIVAGDIVVAIDGEEIGDLRAYAAKLRAHAPGDRIAVRVRRGEDVIDVEATLAER